MTMTIAKPNGSTHGPNGQPPQDRTLAKAMTKSAFLHVQDALAIGKLKVWVGRYQQGGGCTQQASAYLDLSAARVVLGDLLLRGTLPESLYPGAKVEFFGGGERDGQVTARILRFRIDSEKRSPVVVEVATGPGQRNALGGFQPSGEMETVGIYLGVFEARKLAAEVLAQLSAWDVCQEAERRRELHRQKEKGDEP